MEEDRSRKNGPVSLEWKTEVAWPVRRTYRPGEQRMRMPAAWVG